MNTCLYNDYRGRVLIDMSVVKATNPKVMKVPSSAAPEDPREQVCILERRKIENIQTKIVAIQLENGLIRGTRIENSSC